MQHVFEFVIKHPAEEHEFHSMYKTDSGRLGRVAQKLIKDLNKLREAEGLFEYKREDLEKFNIRQHR